MASLHNSVNKYIVNYFLKLLFSPSVLRSLTSIIVDLMVDIFIHRLS